MTELEKYIQIYFGISNEDLTKISSFFKPVTLKKGDFFLKKGKYCDKLGFVQTGLIREFVQIDDKEVTNLYNQPYSVFLRKKFGSLTIFVVVMFMKLILLYISLGEATTFVANDAYTTHTASERRNICLFYAHKQTNVPPLRGCCGNTSDFFYKGCRLSEADV